MDERVVGALVYSEKVGVVTAEVYKKGEAHSVFLVGDRLACFLGSSISLDDCKDEIRCIKALSQSDLFKRVSMRVVEMPETAAEAT